MRVGKGAQPHQVGDAERLHVAQHHRRHVVAAGQLDLRNGFPRIHAADQPAQRHQHVADMLRQHMAFAHVGHIGALAFMKTDQRSAFLAHITHRQAGAVAVTPGGSFNRPQQVVSLDLADEAQVVFQHPLLDGDLRADVQVLHLAAAAGAGVHAEMRTGRPHALGRLVVHHQQRGLFKAAFLAVHIGRHLLERQRAFNENDLAVGAMGNALRLDVERFDSQQVKRIVPGFGRRLEERVLRLFGHAALSQAAGAQRSKPAAHEKGVRPERDSLLVQRQRFTALAGIWPDRPACPGGGFQNAA